jgi:xanthine dehydrogenase accessory factor
MSAGETQTESRTISEAISRVLAEGTIAVLVTLMESPATKPGELRVGAKMLVNESGDRVLGFGDPELDEAVTKQAEVFLRSRVEAKSAAVQEFAANLDRFSGTLFLFERIEGEPRLVICGAGHVGASLARLAALVGYRVTLIDDRAEFVARELFGLPEAKRIELIRAEDWAEATRAAVGKGRGVSVAIVTRGHKQDEDCLRAISKVAPDYVGMIGSKRRTNIVLEKLRDEGFDESELGKVRAPIGLDIGAVSPEEVALAILAEIVAGRRGGKGSSLSEWRR